MEKAIKIAIENGYSNNYIAVNNRGDYIYTESDLAFTFLDPLFWQALGKGLGQNFSMEVPLGKHIAIIDKTTAPILDGYYWEKTVKGYLRGKPKSGGKAKFLHRIVMDAQDGEFVDHINGNKLDNRNVNLRLVSLKENALNKKLTKNGKYRGTFWSKKISKWQVQVQFEKRNYSGGYFKNRDEAALQAEILRRKLFGEWHNPKSNRDWWLETALRFLELKLTSGDEAKFWEKIIK